jgi:phosphomannomutase
VIKDIAAFQAAVNRGLAAAENGKLVTFGIVPDAPDGGYFWNSGMFLFRASAYLDELKALVPDMHKACADSMAGKSLDGDFDRCFLFDEKGTFIEGYYIVGLLAESLLAKNPGGKIIHDPRLTWNTLEIVAASGGEAIQSKSGHSFIKEKMRELISITGKSLSELVGERMAKFPASGEINRKVDDAKATLQKLHDVYAPDALLVDDIDGYCFEFADWRFNIRMSNTEPVVRLNVESRGNEALMREKTAEVLEYL